MASQVCDLPKNGMIKLGFSPGPWICLFLSWENHVDPNQMMILPPSGKRSQFANLNMAIGIVDLPIKKMVMFP